MKDGHKVTQGIEATTLRNIEAISKSARILRTCLGPNGQNKMVINHLEKLFVTSDAATILREMDIVHPAAKMVVQASQMQEKEVGDGSNFVVVFCGELMHLAEGLLRSGLHPSEIVIGYEAAHKKAQEILDTLVCYEEKELDQEAAIANCVRSAIASKQYGNEEFLSALVAKACVTAMPKNAPQNFVVDNVRVCKILGQSVSKSQVVRGMVVPRDTETSIKKLNKVSVAVLNCGIDTESTETKGTVLIHNAKELEQYSLGEESALEAKIKALADSGVQFVFTGGSIGELAQHFLEKHNVGAIKILSKFELRRVAKCVAAKAQLSLGAVPKDEQGYVESIHVEEIGSNKVCIVDQGGQDSVIATVIVRASSESILNDIERAIDDGVNVVKSLGKDARFVAGAGACEIELARLLRDMGAKTPGLEQYAMKKFAQAFEVIPRTLAENAGLNATDIIAKLYAAHESGDVKHGVDIVRSDIGDMTGSWVIDLLITKREALRLAVNTAITVLRVDQIIMAKPAGGPKIPDQKGGWDEDD